MPALSNRRRRTQRPSEIGLMSSELVEELALVPAVTSSDAAHYSVKPPNTSVNIRSPSNGSSLLQSSHCWQLRLLEVEKAAKKRAAQMKEWAELGYHSCALPPAPEDDAEEVRR